MIRYSLAFIGWFEFDRFEKILLWRVLTCSIRLTLGRFIKNKMHNKTQFESGVLN